MERCVTGGVDATPPGTVRALYWIAMPPASTDAETHPPDGDWIENLRSRHYNATICGWRAVNDDLAVFQVRPDGEMKPFQPGQYVTLGLGYFERRLARCQFETLADERRRRLCRRAYSISCPIFRDADAATTGHPDAASTPSSDTATALASLGPVNRLDHYEFYVALVRQGASMEAPAPALTPRLFCLQVGDRLELGKRITGHYHAGGIGADETVLMIGTGTGEAPHNAIATQLIADGHRGPIVHVTTVRHAADLGYLRQHQRLARIADNYHYVPLTTRDRINLDHTHPQYVGKRYIQQFYRDGGITRQTGVQIDPKTTHVFLCGNPAMIGLVPRGGPPLRTPGMTQLLMADGFTDRSDYRGPGRIRFEKYW